MKREIYKQLLEWKLSVNRKPLILQGARQIGKTWILRHFGECEYKQSFYGIICFATDACNKEYANLLFFVGWRFGFGGRFCCSTFWQGIANRGESRGEFASEIVEADGRKV